MNDDSTTRFYSEHAREYADRTFPLDLSAARGRLAALLLPGARIADLGCGAGRDLTAFAAAGFRIVGLDRSFSLLAIARASPLGEPEGGLGGLMSEAKGPQIPRSRPGAPAKRASPLGEQGPGTAVPGSTCVPARPAVDRASRSSVVAADLLDIPFCTDAFDGIWACASLLHVSREAARIAVGEARRILRPGGWIVVLLKQGDGEELAPDGRLFVYYREEEARDLFAGWGFDPVSARTDPGGAGERSWVELLARKPL